MIALLIWIIFALIFLGIAWIIVSYIPLPPPIPEIVKWVFILIGLIIVLYVAVNVLGPPPRLGWR